MSIFKRLLAWLRREPDADLGDELRFHLDMEAAKLQQSGLSVTAARDEARRRLGGVDRYTEELRDVRGGRTMDALAQDARYALRMSRRFPAFTAIVLLTLGISIGANTAIFSVINATLLRPLPFPDGDRLAFLFAQNPDKSIPRFSVSYADLLDWRTQTRSFTGMAGYGATTLNLMGDDEPLRLSGLTVTNDYFEVVGIRPHLGRFYHSKQLASETANEIVLAYAFWQRQFNADSGVIGRQLKIGNGTRTVVGVLPREFDLEGRSVDAVVVLDPNSIPGVQSHGQHMLSAIARLKPGVTQAAAQADLAAVAARLAEQFPDIAGWSANVFMVRDEMVRTIRSPLLVLLAAAGLVLLIGCINVANLLMTRATLREREIALRQAMGASRNRLVSQLVVESAGLAIGGALVGLVVAQFTLKIVTRNAPQGLLPADMGLDPGVLLFALLLAMVTTLAVGLWPAFIATTPRLSRALRDGGRNASGGARALRARRSLVVAETSLALVLLISAGLVIQSLRHMLAVDPGFDPRNVVTMRVTLSGQRYNETTQTQFFRDLQSRLEGRGGVEAVAAANTPPIADGGIVTGVRLLGTSRPNEKTMTAATAVTPGYFRTMGMRVIEGRDVAWTDPRPTLVVSQSAARRYWPGEQAIGKRIAFGAADTVGLEVVGIVSDTRARGITTDIPPMVYMSYEGAASIARTMSIVVRARGDVASVLATTKRAVLEIDRTLPLYSARSVSELIDRSIGQPRLNTTLLTLFASVALVLAVIGIYGVISYSVTQRSQEIGVRMALGADQRDVVRLVLREGAALATLGAVIGIAGAYMATPLIRSWLFGIEKNDAMTIVTTALGLVVIALAASYMPAKRAARVDPLVAMRAD